MVSWATPYTFKVIRYHIKVLTQLDGINFEKKIIMPDKCTDKNLSEFSHLLLKIQGERKAS